MATKRGKESIAELMIPQSPVDVVQRPDAPYDLDDDEAAEWRAQVAAMPADHFPRNSFPLLAQLCRHVVTTRRLAQLLQDVMQPKKGETFSVKAYADLLKMQRAESEAIVSLSRSMRLTQQSVVRAETLSRKLRNQPTMIAAPWAKDDE